MSSHAREDRDALELAAETMSRLAARMSKTLEHTLDKEMSEILAQITGNVHGAAAGDGWTRYRIGRAAAEAYPGGIQSGNDAAGVFFLPDGGRAYADEGRTAAISFGRDLCKL